MISVGFALALGVLGPGTALPARHPAEATQALAAVADQVRRAWAGQNSAGVIGAASRIVVQLPGAEAGAGVGRDQAIRLLEGVFRRSEELETRLMSSREVGPGQGYVELRRRYRLSGTDEVRTQRVLLGFRRGAEGGPWALVELRVVEGAG